jgi:hypothetical protein
MLAGLWLVGSPWIFQYSNSWFYWNDIVSGCAVILLAAASFAHPTRWAHLVIGAVAVWLGASAYFGFDRPGPPAAQNEIVIAVLMLMFFLIPNQASKPPEPWRDESR